MSVSVNSNQSLGNPPRLQSVVSFRGKEESDSFEKSAKNDSKLNNKPESFLSKLFNKIKSENDRQRQLNEISALNKACESLIDNLKETQKTFQKIFLRNDITESETLNIIKRYHALELVGISGNKEEYITKLYAEAKKNYGLSDLPCGIDVINGVIRNNPKMLGYTDPLGNITLRGDIDRKAIFNSIHHELRHVKQDYYAYHYAPEKYVELSQPRNMTIPQEVFEYAYNPDKIDVIIPPEKMEFAQNALNSKMTYCPAIKSESSYLSQWCESDAYWAGNTIEKMFNK